MTLVRGSGGAPTSLKQLDRRLRSNVFLAHRGSAVTLFLAEHQTPLTLCWMGQSNMAMDDKLTRNPTYLQRQHERKLCGRGASVEHRNGACAQHNETRTWASAVCWGVRCTTAHDLRCSVQPAAARCAPSPKSMSLESVLTLEEGGEERMSALGLFPSSWNFGVKEVVLGQG